MLYTGLDSFIANLNNSSCRWKGKRFAYLSNQASTDRHYVQGRILLQDALGEQLTTLFSPQHGFFSEKQDNMVESAHSRDDVTRLPI